MNIIVTRDNIKSDEPSYYNMHNDGNIMYYIFTELYQYILIILSGLVHTKCAIVLANGPILYYKKTRKLGGSYCISSDDDRHCSS